MTFREESKVIVLVIGKIGVVVFMNYMSNTKMLREVYKGKKIKKPNWD